MTIYELLKKDHKKVEALLDKLVRWSAADNDGWKEVVDQIRDELIPHARAEEAVFYNALREADAATGEVLHGYGEHAMAETELRTLQAMKAIDVNWTALAKKLREDILHHVEEEEGKIFKAAQKVLSDEEATMIGKAFTELKPSIKKQGLVGTTLDMVANMLPPRLTAGIKKQFEHSARH